MTPGPVVALTDEHWEGAWRLSRLAFGGDPAAPPPELPTGPPRVDGWGVLDERGRLLGKALLHDYGQWWGGREVPMGGVAGVAVHPDARGTGTASRLLGALLPEMAARGQGISVLFPTVVPLYRSLGWEVVGTLDDTRLATRDLLPSGDTDCTVRTGEAERDAAAVERLYDGWAAAGSGALTRRGRLFPDGAEGAFDGDLVGLAVGPDGAARGYVSYDRGRGYRGGEGELRVWELVAADGGAARALLASLARWHPVASTVLWRGRTAGLQRLVSAPVPPPVTAQPWMLRVVDPVAAVAARGFPRHVTAEAAFVLDDPQQPQVSRAWRLAVADGRGVLTPATSATARLHVRGLALLWAGVATTDDLRRAGLLDGDLPGVDAAVAGPRPALLDYF